MPKRHELTDAQWERIEPLLPGKRSDPGRTAADNRLFVNAVVFVLKTGIPWADLPARFGKQDSARERFDRWCAAGVWQRVARAAPLYLSAAADALRWQAGVNPYLFQGGSWVRCASCWREWS